MTASVVICAYTEQRWPDLERAVGSVLAQSPGPAEVLLVIDHCEALLDRARVAFPAARVVRNSGPKGLSGARNVGYREAVGDIVAFIDDDATAEDGWLHHLLDGYRDEDVQGVGGDVRPRWITGRPGWFPPEFDWVVGCSHAGMPRTTGEVRNVVGANMSLRRKALSTLGGFSSELGRQGADLAGCEETELCIRAAALTPGSRLIYEPAARVLHTVPGERARLAYFVRRCIGEGRSKATVSRMAGTDRGLSSERAYLADTIPRGIRDNAMGALRGDVRGAARVAVLVLGVAATAFGYLQGRLGRVRFGRA